ncbi:MAG: formylmethanofuran dehydrogenase subunit C [Planctomycetes bacterium]|nr:formylmethanofuran dehydrogenase subunit C [Planctomycetota bacterium]
MLHGRGRPRARGHAFFSRSTPAIPMPLVVTPRSGGVRPPLSIDLGGILPERLAGLTVSAAARLPITADERPCRLGDLFDVRGDAADGRLECVGDFSRVHRVAAGMNSGTVRIEGDVGRHAGEGMRGGRLQVSGSAGDWLAAEIAGGEVVVAGDAGHNAAAALPGSPRGGTGGVVLIGGKAGDLAAARRRRGVVAVAGGCGTGAGFEMLAGSLVVGGRLGGHAGLGLRRGSVIALGDRPAPPATFRRGAAWRPAFLPLLLSWLVHAGFAPAAAALRVPSWRQWHGDSLCGCRGELLHPA